MTTGGGFGSGSGPTPDAAVYVISVAAELTGLHPQTLRTYERMGLITPGRTGGGGRRYSPRDLDLLREISELTGAGIGIEGVRRILDLEHRAAALAARNAELQTELDAAHEALRQLTAAQAAQAQAAPVRRGDQPAVPNRLPVLRPSAVDASVVVWRRNR